MCEKCDITLFGYAVNRAKLAFCICMVITVINIYIMYPMAVEEANCRNTCNEMIVNATRACSGINTEDWRMVGYGGNYTSPAG